MESFVLKKQLDLIEEQLRGMAKSQVRKEMVEQLVTDLRYALDHMDECHYGIVFVRNIMTYMEMSEHGTYRLLSNAVVRDTMHFLMHEIDEVKAGKRLQDPNCIERKNTLLPGGKKLFRNHCGYIDACDDGTYTVHFKCGMRGGAPTFDEQAALAKKMIEDAERAA